MRRAHRALNNDFSLSFEMRIELWTCAIKHISTCAPENWKMVQTACRCTAAHINTWRKSLKKENKNLFFSQKFVLDHISSCVLHHAKNEWIIYGSFSSSFSSSEDDVPSLKRTWKTMKQTGEGNLNKFALLMKKWTNAIHNDMKNYMEQFATSA